MSEETSEKLYQDLHAVVEGLGFSIVELKHFQSRNTRKISLVIYRAAGVSVDDCANVLHAVRPRVQMILDDREVGFEISSPGIDRNIKDKREYVIFSGKGVRILEDGKSEWTGGVINGADDKGVLLRCPDGVRHLPYGKIRKAKLDYSQEVS